MQELQTQLWMLTRRARQSVTPIEGVSRSAARMLTTIARHPTVDGIQPSHLAEKLAMTSSNVAAALRELDCAGYIHRRRSPDDGRRVQIMLTDHGRAAITARNSLRTNALRDVIHRSLTPTEQAQLAAAIPLLAKLTAAYAQHLPHHDQPRQ